MKKTWIYGLLLTAALVVPTKTVKLGQMIPVEAVHMFKRGHVVVIATDTGDRASGAAAEQALEKLKEGASGILCLDTAKYLLVGTGAEDQIPQIAAYLKPDTYLCTIAGKVDLVEASAYLDVHRPKLRLSQWNMETELQILTIGPGGKRLK